MVMTPIRFEPIKCFISICAGVILCLTVGLRSADAASTGYTVRTESGLVEGTAENSVRVWRGIRYASPPVGQLRWAPPHPMPKFTGVFKATEFGASCPQIKESPTQLSRLTKFSEDCLFLNIWAPGFTLPDDKKYPVLVWIHGGGFIAGSGSEAQFDGTEFAKRGIILVTFNYRLGRLGFFAHPALSAHDPDVPTGNYALMDQIEALRWVKTNIAVFGGDSNNVTLAGESAGAISAVAISTIPSTRGLFHKLIIESAPMVLPFRDVRLDKPGLPSAESIGKDWAESRGVHEYDPEAVTVLRSLPVELISPSSASLDEISAIMVASRPMHDGRILRRNPVAVYADKQQISVPIIVGSNGREDVVWSFEKDRTELVPVVPLTEEDILAQISDRRGREQVTSYYQSLRDGREQMRGDAFAGSSAYFLAGQALSASVWLYRFDTVPSQMRKVVDKAPHGTELFYVFQTLDRFPHEGFNAKKSDEKMARFMSQYWINFIRNGAPGREGGVEWKSFNKIRPEMLHFRQKDIRNALVRESEILEILAPIIH